MPSIKTNFKLKDSDIERIQKAIIQCGDSAEEKINDYLKNVGGEKIATGISKFIPRSNRNKTHAKTSKWWKQLNYNLAVVVENNNAGKRNTSFYYLYYPATGTGTSKKKGKNDFMGRGLNSEYQTLVNGLINELDENIEKEMKI